jgi:hypothetical protein
LGTFVLLLLLLLLLRLLRRHVCTNSSVVNWQQPPKLVTDVGEGPRSRQPH